MLILHRNLRFATRGSMVCVLALAALVVSGAAAPAQTANQGAGKASTLDQKAPGRKTFASPREAAEALYRAAHDNDENAILMILGPGARDLVIWSDDPAERKGDVDVFVRKYDQMHRLVKEPDNETTLYVGSENWPLPIPIVGSDGHWYFDAALGRQEILYRRIGENEKRAIDALYSLCMAENEYYSDHTSDPEYAARLDAEKGKRDGLYWPATNREDASPIGSYLANAAYTHSDRQPFYGYFFNVLTAQGVNARGGARNYIAGDKMTGGFAFIAFPAAYRLSGVRTFIVNRDGVVYEKDLGPNTAKIAAAITTFNPDPTWTRAQ
jgi:DUF2950 family protein